MRGRHLIIAVLVIIAAAGCRGRSEDASANAGKNAPAVADGAGIPEAPVEVCVECSGLGRSPHSGDHRPCFLCSGDGRCALCEGEGQHRDGLCSSCEGSGKCVDCAGDGQISAGAHDPGSRLAPVSGDCPVCSASIGFCPECGGRAVLSGDRPCRFCEGQSWCPECRGARVNRFCGGDGLCPLCGGRGKMKGSVPAPGLHPLRVHTTDGSVFEAELLSAPSRVLPLKRTDGAKVQREAISLGVVAPNDVLLAYRQFAAAEGSRLRIASARYLLKQGPEFLSAARHDAHSARSAGAASSEVDLVLAGIDKSEGEWLLAEAAKVQETEPGRALIHLYTHRLAFRNSGDAAEVEKLIADLESAAAAAAEAVPAEVRERRAAAEAEQFRRQARRAEEWRVRAEDLLARVDASEDDFLRADRSAFQAWLIFSRAANGAGPDLADPLLENAHQARSLRIRSLLGLGWRLLERGYLKRARSLAMVGLSLDPADAGAIQFVAEVEGALGRLANEVKDR